MDEKAAKKLAKQQAREEMLIKIRKETLEREKAMDEATLHKIKDKWFNSVVETKVPQMQDNLRHILHYMEKLIEAENFRKSLFEDERQDMETDATLLAQSHGTAMERLFDIYQKRIQDMHNAYCEMVAMKKEDAELEFSKIEDREKTTQENLQTMLYQKHEDREKAEDAMNCSMFFQMDDERSKNTEVKEDLRTRLEKKMEKRWGEITATLSKYEETTKERRKEYLQLKMKDDSDSKIITQQMKKTQKLFEQLEELRNCMDDCYAPQEMINLIRDTHEERTKFFNTFKRLKLILKQEVNLDAVNLKTLTVVTNELTTRMKEICTKGEQILTLYRICLRLETEQEKVMPVGDVNLPKTAVLAEPRKKLKSSKEPDKSSKEPDKPSKEPDKSSKEPEKELKEPTPSQLNWIVEAEMMGKFWRKVGKAQLSRMALAKCVQNLEKENKLLKKILTSYLHELSAKI